jgi:hypothetical protein
MNKQTFSDPLIQPFESCLDFLGIHGDFKNWLEKLGAGVKVTGRYRDKLISRIENLPCTAGVEERKAVFLFRDPGALPYFDGEKLDEERLNIIPSLFSREYGTFYCYVNGILPEIKAYAETRPAFKAKYAEAKKNARENSSAAGRMEIYLHPSRPYPPALIAELEGIAESGFVPELLPFLYWGKEAYLIICRLSRGNAGKDLYRKIPRWNCGSYASLPFIGYAAVKQDVRILEAVFEGVESTRAIWILARLFYAGIFHDEYRRFTNWLDEAIVQDFYKKDCSAYRGCGDLLIDPGKEDKAELFFKYCTVLLEQNTAGTDLPVVKLFFPGAAPEEYRDILRYLNDIDPGRRHEGAYWRLIKLIVQRAACRPSADLLSRERFKTCDRGDIGMAFFYIFEEYLNAVKPDRKDIVLLGAYICAVFKNQSINTPPLLLWLFKYTRFADHCRPFIGETAFLKALLAASGEHAASPVITCGWIHYVAAVWLLFTYRDRKPDPQWPVRIGGEIKQQFEDADGEKLLYTAAALLFSPGEIGADPVLLDAVWNLFLGERETGSVRREPGFIPYLCFVRAGKDEDKVEAMIKEIRPELAAELPVMRYLKVNEKFDFDDFILQLDDIDKIESLPPEFFAWHRTTRDKAVLHYLERHGATFAKAERIAACYSGSDMDASSVTPYIVRAAAETEPEYLCLFTLLALYLNQKGEIDGPLDEDPGKAAAVLGRCKRRLVLLRKDPGTGTADDERRYCYLTAFYAAYFIARRKDCWSGLKPLVLAFRHADKPLLKINLRPAGGIEENIAAQINRFLHWKWEEGKMKTLRRDMARDLLNYIKPRKYRNGGAAGLRNGGREYGSHERSLEGFALNYTEPNHLWRYAFVRALDDLAVDSDGKGLPLHHTLHKAAKEDPSPQVQKQAELTEKQLRRIRNGCEEGFHNHRLMQAFWWMRWAHMHTLESPVNEIEALRTRNTEYR